MGDPNWLLSTCSQASAAIIAILGGFLVSRIMTIYSEKNGIINELNDVNNKSTFKLHALAEVDKKRLIMEQEEFFEKCEDDIIEKASKAFHNGQDVSKIEVYFDEYYLKNNERGIEYDELKSYFDNRVKIIKMAFLLFQTNGDRFNIINKDLDKFIIENNIELENCNIYKNVFKAIFHRNETLDNKSLINLTYINKVNNKINKIKSIPQMQKYEKLIYTKEVLELEVKFLQQQREQLESKINYFEKPKGLIWAIIIFIYFSIVGIIFPMFLMPMSIEKFTYAYKYTVIGLFISGIILVFTYLILAINHIYKKY